MAADPVTLLIVIENVLVGPEPVQGRIGTLIVSGVSPAGIVVEPDVAV
jgi:hypothetical protein